MSVNLAPRKFDFNSAAREEIKIKAGLDGPSGSGKTLSAILMAYGLAQTSMPEGTDPAIVWSKVGVADTENKSALYYRGRGMATPDGDVRIGKFTHIPFDPPYDPRYYSAMIEQATAAGLVVLVIDSVTHEWTGDGGCLDLQRKVGGRAQDWAFVSPLHTKFIDDIRFAPLHVICTLRTKQEYAITTVDGDGGRKKTNVEKLGLKPEQRDGFDYELGVVFNVDHKTHAASAGKDRTGLFAGQPPFLITPETGRTIGEWCKGGVSAIGSQEWFDQRCHDIEHCATLDVLKDLFSKTQRQALSLLTDGDRARLIQVKDKAKDRITRELQGAATPQG